MGRRTVVNVYRVVAALCVAALAVPVHAQTDSGPAEEAADVFAFGDDAANRMTVPVSIGGSGPFPFIVDTGAERTIVSDELALRLGLGAVGTADLHTVSGVGTVNTVSVPSLQVSGTAVSGLTAPVLKARNIGASGMLGIDSLQKQRVLLDFRNRTMTVTKSERRREKPADDDTIVVSARNRLGRLILVDAAVNGRKVAVVIDTGAEFSIGNAALRRRVMGGKRNVFVVPTIIHSVTGGKVPAEIAVVREMRVGSLNLTDMPIAFANLSIFRQLGLDHKPALLLGMNTMRAFDSISVDFANRSVRFVVPGESKRSNLQTALADD